MIFSYFIDQDQLHTDKGHWPFERYLNKRSNLNHHLENDHFKNLTPLEALAWIMGNCHRRNSKELFFLLTLTKGLNLNEPFQEKFPGAYLLPIVMEHAFENEFLLNEDTNVLTIENILLYVPQCTGSTPQQLGRIAGNTTKIQNNLINEII